MPMYTFELRDGERPVMDETGVWFADQERAIEHAQNVARELMWGRELQTRSWHLDVYEAGTCVHQLLFASIDPTLDHLRPALRMNVEQSCDTLRGFKEAMAAARATVLEARARVARSRVSSRSHTNDRSEVIILITPRLSDEGVGPAGQDSGRKLPPP